MEYNNKVESIKEMPRLQSKEKKMYRMPKSKVRDYLSQGRQFIKQKNRNPWYLQTQKDI